MSLGNELTYIVLLDETVSGTDNDRDPRETQQVFALQLGFFKGYSLCFIYTCNIYIYVCIAQRGTLTVENAHIKIKNRNKRSAYVN